MCRPENDVDLKGVYVARHHLELTAYSKVMEHNSLFLSRSNICPEQTTNVFQDADVWRRFIWWQEFVAYIDSCGAIGDGKVQRYFLCNIFFFFCFCHFKIATKKNVNNNNNNNNTEIHVFNNNNQTILWISRRGDIDDVANMKNVIVEFSPRPRHYRFDHTHARMHTQTDEWTYVIKPATQTRHFTGPFKWCSSHCLPVHWLHLLMRPLPRWLASNFGNSTINTCRLPAVPISNGRSIFLTKPVSSFCIHANFKLASSWLFDCRKLFAKVVANFRRNQQQQWQQQQ